MDNKKIGYVYVGLASFFFAIIAIIGKTALSSGIGAYDLVLLQNIMTVIILFVYFVFKDIKLLKIDRHDFLLVVLQGIIGSALTTVFFYKALETINAGIASMLIFTHPVLVNLFFIVTRLKKINAVNNAALVLAFCGSTMVLNVFALGVGKTPLIGIAFGMLSSISYAFYNVFADLKLRKLEPAVINFYTSLTSMVFVLMLNPGFLKFGFTLNPKVLFYVFELSVISGILPVIFLYKGIAHIGAEKSSIVATSELPITILMAYLFLSERMNLVQISGVLLIIGAIIILQNEVKLLNLKIFKRAGKDMT